MKDKGIKLPKGWKIIRVGSAGLGGHIIFAESKDAIATWEYDGVSDVFIDLRQYPKWPKSEWKPKKIRCRR